MNSRESNKPTARNTRHSLTHTHIHRHTYAINTPVLQRLIHHDLLFRVPQAHSTRQQAQCKQIYCTQQQHTNTPVLQCLIHADALFRVPRQQTRQQIKACFCQCGCAATKRCATGETLTQLGGHLCCVCFVCVCEYVLCGCVCVLMCVCSFGS